MAKAIDSGMSNIANRSRIYNSENDIITKSENKIKYLDEMKALLINIEKNHKDFSLENWINCNNLKEKTEREIYMTLSAQYDKNTILYHQCLDRIKKSEPFIKKIDVDNNYSTNSLSDFFYEVKQSIIVGKHDYLDVLRTLFSNYMDYVSELRTTLTSIGQYIKAGKKDGYVSINFIKFYGELKNLIKKYKDNEKSPHLLYKKLSFEYLIDSGGYSREIGKERISYLDKNQIKKSEESIEKTLKEIKGVNTVKNYLSEERNKENIVSEYASSSAENESLSQITDINILFVCKIDFSDIESLIKTMEPYLVEHGILLDSDIESKREYLVLKREKEQKEIDDLISSGGIYESIQPITNVDREINNIIENNNKKIEGNIIFNDKLQTEFDLFKKSLDSLEKKINTNLDELSKKYSMVNSNYDNFVKIVSSTMNILLEMAKGFLRF